MALKKTSLDLDGPGKAGIRSMAVMPIAFVETAVNRSPAPIKSPAFDEILETLAIAAAKRVAGPVLQHDAVLTSCPGL